MKKAKEELIKTLEEVSTFDLLLGYGYKKEYAEELLSKIGEIAVIYNVKPAIMRVILEYVAAINDTNISVFCVEKVAKSWFPKNIKTIEEAMELARSEYKERELRKVKHVQSCVYYVDSINEMIKTGLSDKDLGIYVKSLLK